MSVGFGIMGRFYDSASQFTCVALNRHYSEMNPAVCVIVCIHVRSVLICLKFVAAYFLFELEQKMHMLNHASILPHHISF